MLGRSWDLTNSNSPVRLPFRAAFFLGPAAAPALVAGGPAGWVALGVLSLASAVELFAGTAHKVADDLTRPGTGPQWIWEHQTLPALINPLAQKKADGTITIQDVQDVLDGLETARQRMLQALASFGMQKAAIQARDMVNRITDLLKEDRRKELADLQAAAGQPGVVPEGGAEVPTMNRPSHSVWWALLLLLVIVLAAVLAHRS